MPGRQIDQVKEYVVLSPSGKQRNYQVLSSFFANCFLFYGRDKWPRAVRANGHLLLNSDKVTHTFWHW